MNDKFISLLKNNNISQYKLSKDTGIPFSTINGLMCKTHEINRCSVPTVAKLANYFKVDISDIIDSYPVMNNVCGQYMEYRYKWQVGEDGLMDICILNLPEKTVIHTGYQCDSLKQMPIYKLVAEMLIDIYMEQKKAEEALLEALNGRTESTNIHINA